MNCRNPLTPQRRTRWWQKLALAGAALLVGLGANAQVSAYTFAQTPGTYNATSGGATQIIAPNTDDASSAATNIGFTFVYNGTSFTQFVANSNGNIRLGSASPTSPTTPISTTTNTNAISLLGRDGLSVGGVFVETTGTPGSRICTIEFRTQQLQWNNTTSRMTGQIRLFEGTNVVEMVFGTGIQGTTFTVQLGLRGTSGATDFSTRTTTTNWAATTTGALSSSTMTYSTTAFPASGQTYTWTPPVPCVGPLNAGSVPSPVSACSGGTTTLSATGLSTGTGLTLQWEESPDGVNSWANVVGGTGATTANYTTTAVTATRYFRLRSNCTNGPATNVSNVVTVNVFAGSSSEDFSSGNLTANCWTPSGTVAPANFNYATVSAFGAGIGSIRYNFFNATGGQTLIYTSPVFTALGAGQNMTFDVAGATYAGEADQITLQESNDGGTTWTNVQVMTNVVGGLLNTGGASVPLFVPTAAQWISRSYPLSAGTNRVRFNGVSAFGNAVYLDNLAIAATPTCFTPTGITLNGVTPTTAQVSWTDANSPASSGYEWEIRSSGAAGSGLTGLLDSGSETLTTANAEGLTANTTYSFYVRAECGEDEFSPWSSPFPVFTGYCAAGASTQDELITRVIFSNVDNPSTGWGPSGYQDFTAQAANVVPGETYQLSVARAPIYTSGLILAWIDWNNDLVFDPVTEVVATSAIGVGSPYLVDVTIPPGQAAGNYRLRIRLTDTDPAFSPIPNPTPCGPATWGQVEDYTVSVCGAPTATASVSANDCTAQTFQVTVVTTNIGTGATASLEYSYDGVPQTPIAYADADIVISNIPVGTTVTASLVNNLGCSVDLGQLFSSCDIELDCDADAILQSHCYETGDTRTWTYVNADPTGTVDLKFLSGTMDVNDQFLFWEGAVNGTPASPASLNGLLTGSGVISTGNVLSMSIVTDGTGSCEDGAFGGITWQVRCGGCTEPAGFLTVDENDLGFPLIECGVTPGTGTFNPWVGIEDNGIDENTGEPPATVGYLLTVNGSPQTPVTGLPGGDFYDLGTYALGTQILVTLLHEDQVGQSACNNNLTPVAFTVPLSACAPSNDDCADALPIVIGAPGSCPAAAFTSTTLGGTQDGANPACAGGAVQDVWYTLNTTDFSGVTFSVVGGTAGQIGLQIFNSCGVPQGACLADAEFAPVINYNLAPAEYRLRFFTTAANAGDFTVCFSGIAAPPGNTCATAINLNSAISPISGNTSVAGTTNNLNTSCLTNTANDLVYFIDVPAGNTLTLTNTTSYDSQIRVAYGASCPGDVELFCWDDPNGQTNSWTNATGDTQRVYWIQDGWSSSAGAFTLAWTNFPPPVDCTIPAPGNTLSNLSVACPGNALNLGIQNLTNDNGLTYQWEVSTDGGATWDPSGPATPTWSTTFTVPAQYRNVVTCTLSSESVASTPVSVGQDTPAACLCIPTYTFGKTDGDLISNVVIAGTTLANNTGTAPVNPAYTFFTGAPNLTADLQAGTVYTIQVSTGTFASQNFAVWIDFNEDGVFTLSERVGTASNVPALSTVSFPLSLPCDPIPGVKRMRIRDVWNLAATSIDPCANYGYGETEDYEVTILPPPACSTPGNLAGTNLSFEGIDLTWTAGCTETAWIVEYGVDGFTLGTGTQVPVATAAYTIAGLDALTAYDVYIYADCGVDGLSAPFGPGSFTTLQAPPANNLCANAIPVGCNSSTAGTTVGATNADAPNECITTLGSAPGVWYTVQGWGGGMTASLCGAAFDTKIGVFTGTCGTLTCVTGNDDDSGLGGANACGGGVSSSTSWTSVSGETYYIYVTGFSTAAGTFNLSIGCGTTGGGTCSDNGLSLEFQTDAFPDEVTWEIRTNSGAVYVTGGGPLVAPNGIQTQALCLPDGCYTLAVFDEFGDGITNGGYTLREAGPASLDTRIIDNFRNFLDGDVSAIGNGPNVFCLPIGTQKPIFVARDKMDWFGNEFFVCEPDPAVSAGWIPGAPNNLQSSTTGYQFWFFDPNGSYSFRRGRAHNTSDGFGPANEFRACHMRINNWAVANQIPANVMMNVRVRTRVDGDYGEFGPAYRFMIDPVAAACPQTKLNDIPNQPALSCNSNRNWGAGNFVHARQVSGANRYQFRFRIPAEGFIKVVTSNTYFQQLNWAADPLQPGKTYEVQVRASKDGGVTWCATGAVWGPSCTLTINNQAQNGEQNLGMGNTTGSLAMWPNPNQGDQLWIDLNGIEADVQSVSVDIFDMTGKQIVARILPTQGDRLNTVLNLNGDLATGMYLVNITAGQKRYTERLVIAN